MPQNISDTGRQDTELLEELIILQKKELRRARITALAGVIIAAAVLAVLALLVPRVQSLMEHMEASLNEIDALAAEAGSVMTGLSETLIEAESLVRGANRVLENNTDGVSEALEKVNSVDFQRLNEAVNSLADAVEPLARFASLFR